MRYQESESQWKVSGGNCIHATLTCTHKAHCAIIAPPMPPDREFVLTLSGAPRHKLSYDIKMAFSSVTDAEMIGQLCYIIVKPAGTPAY